MTPARLAALEHIAVASQRAKLEELTKPKRGRRWRPPSRIVPSFSAALVRASEAYTVIPSRLVATILDAFGLRQLSFTGPKTKVAIAQAWSPRFDKDAGHIWLRGWLRRVFDAAGRSA